MSVPAAYISVVLLWSTTPLAIQWSSQGWGYMFGVTGRMLIGTIIGISLLLVSRTPLPMDRNALRTYLAAGLGIYGAMMGVYWGSQYIPSGLVAVLFGLTPVTTALLAAQFLQESSLTLGKIFGGLLGVSGLIIIFGSDIEGHHIAWYGIAALMVAVVIHSASAVWVKRIDGKYPALAITTGGLIVSVPLYLITWWIVDGQLPPHFPVRAVAAIVYLGVFGSVLGFSLYFYILKKLEANRVALIPLITPVSALVIGQLFNNETISLDIWVGAIFILLAVISHHWGDNWLSQFKSLRVFHR